MAAAGGFDGRGGGTREVAVAASFVQVDGNRVIRACIRQSVSISAGASTAVYRIGAVQALNGVRDTVHASQDIVIR